MILILLFSIITQVYGFIKNKEYIHKYRARNYHEYQYDFNDNQEISFFEMIDMIFGISFFAIFAYIWINILQSTLK